MRDLIKKIKNFLYWLFEGYVPMDTVEDGMPYYVLPEKRVFMQNTVKGDFRLHRMQSGFCANWGEKIVALADDGSLRWPLEGWGRCMAVSPDGTKFIAAQQTQLCIFNAATGTALQEPIELPGVLDFVVGHDEFRIMGTDAENIYVFDESGQMLNVVDNAIEKGGFIGGLCPDQRYSNRVTILDVNHRKLKKIDTSRNQVIQELYADAAEQLFCSKDAHFIWTTVVDGSLLDEIKVLNNRNLREKFGFPFHGKKGVRFAGQQFNDISFHNWVALPDLSPNRHFFLINDNSGQLRMVDAQIGALRRIFSRKLLDFVHAVLWLDDEYFVVMLEGGFVAKMGIRKKELDFKHKDL